jgi:hypothetical protein
MSDESVLVTRNAKLFEAGEYPDKNLIVEEADLDRLVAGFDKPVPLWIEHQDQPLQLGVLAQVWREGRELFGRLELTPEANALIEKSRARKLSVAVTKTLDQIIEVSLVRHPRVADARLFGDSVNFQREFDGLSSKEVKKPMSQSETEANERAATAEERARAAEERANSMVFTLKASQAEAIIEAFKRAGKLCPAAESHARTLLMTEEPVQFGDTQQPLSKVFEQFLNAQPAVVIFGEVAPSAAIGPAHDLSPEDTAFFKRNFPGLDLNGIAKYRKEAS